MGVCVGRSAALCRVHNCSPRDIYEKHLEQAKHLWRVPGAQRFADFDSLKASLPK
jgi:hypothetical protein